MAKAGAKQFVPAFFTRAKRSRQNEQPEIGSYSLKNQRAEVRVDTLLTPLYLGKQSNKLLPSPSWFPAFPSRCSRLRSFCAKFSRWRRPDFWSSGSANRRWRWQFR
jgi:hypothetical protein